jgi:hypothetical protein
VARNARPPHRREDQTSCIRNHAPFVSQLFSSFLSVRCALEGTATTSPAVTRCVPGTKDPRPLRNAKEETFSHDKMAVKFAVDGKEPRDATNPTAPSTSAPAVAPSRTTPSSVPKPRNNLPTTPYKPNEWHATLQNAGLLTCFHSVPTGLHEGFSVDFPIISRIQNPPNKESVKLYLDEFNKTISNETNKKRYLGPFTLPILVNLIGPFQSSPISIIPKPGRPGKFRLIQNFSYPLTPSLDFPSPSINSFISTEKFPTTWGTFEIIALLIARLPPGSEAATRDVAEAYRTIPLHPSQWPAAVIRAPDDLYYINKCLSFGAAPSAGAYGHVADTAAEIFRSEGIGPLDKWVDDHVFFRVRRAHLANYNNSQAAWNLDIQNSGPIRQSGSRLVWYPGKDHMNSTADELNEDCGKPILDLSHQSSRSKHDTLFTYCLDDINQISDSLGKIQRPTFRLVDHLHRFCLGSKLALSISSCQKNRKIQECDQRMAKPAHPHAKRRTTTVWKTATCVSRTTRRQGVPHRP